MFAWIAENLATILICLGLAGIVAAVITGLALDRKKGKTSCGGNCAHCGMNCPYHNRK